MRERRTILIVEDHDTMRGFLARLVAGWGHAPVEAASGEEALARVEAARASGDGAAMPTMALLDVHMGGIDGLETLVRLKEMVGDALRVIMVSGAEDAKTIVEAMRRGADDFVKKPFEPEELELTIRRVLERRNLEDEVTALRRRVGEGGADEYQLLFANSEAMAPIREIVDQIADTPITVLIGGESGTGKGMVARAIHARSGRAKGPFVKVNCAALPDELLESELFGYEPGAFTGAHKRKPGKFEIADGGTIFLDEIGEMPPMLQAKLLQVLQDGSFAVLGGREDVQVDVRVIAATNVDIERMVATGAFREDLYYRLNVVSLRLPPLRERPGELPLLADYLLARYAEQYGRPKPALGAETWRLFERYPWPGNVRELENAVKRIVVLGNEQIATAELSARAEAARAPAEPAPAGGAETAIDLSDPATLSLKEVSRAAARAAERRLIGRVLEHTRWNRKETAEILQISYKALLYKIKDTGLDRTPLGRDE